MVHSAGIPRRCLLTLLLASLFSLLLVVVPPPGPAHAAEQFTNALVTPTLRAADGGPWVTAMRLRPITAKKGQKLYLTAKLAATSNADRGPMMGARIVCLATGGGGGSPYTTRNHSGEAYGIQSVMIRWLFTPPADNTYYCEVRGRADTSLDPDHARLTLQSTSYLRARFVYHASRQWGDYRDACVGQQAIPGHPACGSAKEQAKVLDRRIGVGTSTFTAAADIELTRQYGGYPGGDAKVRTILQVGQTRADGSLCTESWHYDSAYSTISSNIHHLKVHRTISDIPVKTGNGCTMWFRIRVHVKSFAGNPVLIHNLVYSNAFVLL